MHRNAEARQRVEIAFSDIVQVSLNETSFIKLSFKILECPRPYSENTSMMYYFCSRVTKSRQNLLMSFPRGYEK